MSWSDWPARDLPDRAEALPKHIGDFDCGQPALNHFIREMALFNQQSGISRTTYCHPAADSDTVAGYYTLALNVVPHDELPGRVRRRLTPQPMQACVLLGRLAVDNRFKGQGLGGRLMALAMADAVTINEKAGGPVLAVRPIDEAAVRFYEHYGFTGVPDAGHMFLRMSTAKKLLGVSK